MDISYMTKEQVDQILSKKGCDLMVVTASGRGSEFADEYSVRFFNTYAEADEYMKSVNDPESEEWTVAELMTEGQSFYALAGEIHY